MSIYRRRLMIANALKKSDSNINYPGLIAAWSAAGKSNDDADRDVLRDLTGKGHDITLKGFAFNTEGSGYGHPEYPDALVFDGVDDYGNCDMINANLFKENFTFICKREYITEPSPSHLMTTANCKAASLNASIFAFEGFLKHPYIGVYSNNGITYNNAPVDYSLNTIFLTPTNYNGHTFKHSGENNYEDNARINIGRLIKGGRYANMAFYSAYLFDRSLDEQEIKAFIRKYIDADYVLPSEQTTE